MQTESALEYSNHAPHVIVLAGSNGAGKSTAAPRLLRGKLHVHEFVNADIIAQGISAYNSNAVAFQAGQIFLTRLRELAANRRDFAFETTLASRSIAPWLSELCRCGYRFHLFFFWLPSADAAIARVTERVRIGGHDVPEETIRRRYERGIGNFFQLYRPLTTMWRFYDNSGVGPPRILAQGTGSRETRIADESKWIEIGSKYGVAR